MMYDFLSYGSYNNNEMSGVYVRFTPRYHTKPRHFKQWSMKAAARSSCPAPATDPGEIKKKKKKGTPPRTHHWLPAWKRTLAGKLWMAMMESSLHPTPRPENFRNLSLLRMGNDLSLQRELCISLSLSYCWRSACCNIWLALVSS